MNATTPPERHPLFGLLLVLADIAARVAATPRTEAEAA